MREEWTELLGAKILRWVRQNSSIISGFSGAVIKSIINSLVCWKTALILKLNTLYITYIFREYADCAIIAIWHQPSLLYAVGDLAIWADLTVYLPSAPTVIFWKPRGHFLYKGLHAILGPKNELVLAVHRGYVEDIWVSEPDSYACVILVTGSRDTQSAPELRKVGLGLAALHMV